MIGAKDVSYAIEAFKRVDKSAPTDGGAVSVGSRPSDRASTAAGPDGMNRRPADRASRRCRAGRVGASRSGRAAGGEWAAG